MFLINNNFKKISWSNLFAQFAEQIALSAAPLVAVLLLSATASETAWIQTSLFVPWQMPAVKTQLPSPFLATVL
ncbi:Uncharacterised protein [Pragia fontium]|uniref:hypothetical protein n=1 Tax=Pragia fontium TaxID=82985 RepID=UPI000DFA2DB9|nr:hypothetical protein [Pragia fontium]SUB82601.1 Uncharacterised protein [Pragia fontium]